MKQLRIATIGDYSNYYSYFLYGTMEGSIRCGAWFRPIQLLGVDLKQVEEQINFFKPHILFSHCIFNARPEGWRENVLEILKKTRKRWGTFVCYHMGDARTNPRYPHDISSFVDLGLVNNMELNHWKGIWKIPCINWPYAALYQEQIAEKDKRFEYPLVFTGELSNQGHHEERTNFISSLREKNIHVKIFPDSEFGNSRFMTAEISSSAKAVLGSQMGKEIFGYVDVRPFQYIGAGALFFQERHRNIDLFFEPYVHYVPYKENNISNFVEQYNRFAGDRKIRDIGFMFCQEIHSTKKRVEQVIKIYQEKAK